MDRALLRSLGESTRSIAAIVGVSHEAVRWCILQLVAAGAFVQPDEVVGRNGVTYPSRREQ